MSAPETPTTSAAGEGLRERLVALLSSDEVWLRDGVHQVPAPFLHRILVETAVPPPETAPAPGEGCCGQDCGQCLAAPVRAEGEGRDAALERVRAVLDEWGALEEGDGFAEDFAEAIQDSGAWRLSRDLRRALDKDDLTHPGRL